MRQPLTPEAEVVLAAFRRIDAGVHDPEDLKHLDLSNPANLRPLREVLAVLAEEDRNGASH